jgi:hypothetical protein
MTRSWSRTGGRRGIPTPGPRDLMMRLSPEAVRRRVMERLLRRHTPPRRAPALRQTSTQE